MGLGYELYLPSISYSPFSNAFIISYFQKLHLSSLQKGLFLTLSTSFELIQNIHTFTFPLEQEIYFVNDSKVSFDHFFSSYTQEIPKDIQSTHFSYAYYQVLVLSPKNIDPFELKSNTF